MCVNVDDFLSLFSNICEKETTAEDCLCLWYNFATTCKETCEILPFYSKILSMCNECDKGKEYF